MANSNPLDDGTNYTPGDFPTVDMAAVPDAGTVASTSPDASNGSAFSNLSSLLTGLTGVATTGILGYKSIVAAQNPTAAKAATPAAPTTLAKNSTIIIGAVSAVAVLAAALWFFRKEK